MDHLCIVALLKYCTRTQCPIKADECHALVVVLYCATSTINVKSAFLLCVVRCHPLPSSSSPQRDSKLKSLNNSNTLIKSSISEAVIKTLKPTSLFQVFLLIAVPGTKY